LRRWCRAHAIECVKGRSSVECLHAPHAGSGGAGPSAGCSAVGGRNATWAARAVPQWAWRASKVALRSLRFSALVAGGGPRWHGASRASIAAVAGALRFGEALARTRGRCGGRSAAVAFSSARVGVGAGVAASAPAASVLVVAAAQALGAGVAAVAALAAAGVGCAAAVGMACQAAWRPQLVSCQAVHQSLSTQTRRLPQSQW
jgi:hypothetical protein